MVKFILFVAIPLAALVTAFCWRLSQLLSPDAIAMAIGLAFGVLAGLPTAVLITVASQRSNPPPVDGYSDYGYLDAPVTYADEVTPYTHLFRRAVNLQPLLPHQDPAVVERTYLAQRLLDADEKRGA